MNDPDLEAVRFRAYQIWDREGRPHGRDKENWLQALRELGFDEPERDHVRAAIPAQTREWDAAEGEQ